MGIIEGYWDCDQCDTKGIKGRFRNCPNCGKPKGKDATFYMKETDIYVEEDICKEPDWYCSYCDSLNSAELSNCMSCGSSREDSDTNYFKLQEEKKQEELEKAKRNEEILNDCKRYLNEPAKTIDIKKCSTKNDPLIKSINDSNKNSKSVKSSFDFTQFFKKAALVTIPILLILMVIWAFMPKPQTLHIQDKSWSRSIEIEEYKTVKHSGWNVPSGGRVYSQSREIHHYDQVIDRYESKTIQKSERYISGYKEVVTGHRDLGNGYFEEVTSKQPIYDTRYWTETVQEPVYKSVPVYQTKYYYEIERWVHKEYIEAEGKVDPYWPEKELQDNERWGTKNAEYFLYAINEKDKKQEQKQYSIDEENWNQINIGDIIEVEVILGVIVEVLE